ncbi:MAG: hypothetical protein FJ247_10950 [Nitrospira sp.]|nr:hypothetical protein [Nitrospira sp.]
MMIGTREIVHQVHPHLGESLRAGILSGLSERQISPQSVSRRHEERVTEQRVCTYALCESLGEETVVIQEGEAYSLNRSQHGIMLIMGYSPNAKQILELHIPEAQWRRSLNVYEVQWTKPVTIESRGDLYLIGCKLVFGPSRYWAF